MRLSLSMRVVALTLVAASASAQAGRPADPNLTRARALQRRLGVPALGGVRTRRRRVPARH